VILEATGAHFGVVPVQGEFLRGLRELTAARDIVLIFDEVISGFRVDPGGAQGYYEITPDLTTMAKILAGGLPGGCVAGRQDILEHIEFNNPSGRKMKHPGTFNANPLSSAAGTTTLEIVADGVPNRKANESAATLRAALNRLFEQEGVNWVSYGEFSGVKILPEYDGPRPSSDDFIPYDNQYDKLDHKFDPQLSRAFRCALLLGGVDMPGWRGMTCCEHTQEDLDRVVGAVAGAIKLLRADGLLQ
jgi:glutamate-1-semialdehyde 2,1-aminomutase